MTTDNTKEQHLLKKNKYDEAKRNAYNNISDIPMEYAEAEVVTSVDFVFIEGEGWKLESEQ